MMGAGGSDEQDEAGLRHPRGPRSLLANAKVLHGNRKEFISEIGSTR